MKQKLVTGINSMGRVGAILRLNVCIIADF